MTRQRAGRGGRRPGRFLPGVEALEGRLVPAVNFIVQGSTLFIVGPTTRGAGGQQIIITDTGGSGPNNVTAFSTQPFFPNVPISNVVVSTGRADDRVAYNLIGDLTTARLIDVSPGGGADQFTATVRRSLLAGSSLTINAHGGPGPDTLEAVVIGSLAANSRLAFNYDGGSANNTLSVRTASAVSVAAGASLTENLTGGGFSDHIVSRYQGVMSGRLQINARGGRGPNTLSVDIEMAAGSTGQVLPSSLVGGPRQDTLTFVVHNPGTAASNSQSLDGDGGFDTAVRTTNVVVSHVERDRVVR
jgi:hypothetical protein